MFENFNTSPRMGPSHVPGASYNIVLSMLPHHACKQLAHCPRPCLAALQLAARPLHSTVQQLPAATHAAQKLCKPTLALSYCKSCPCSISTPAAPPSNHPPDSAGCILQVQHPLSEQSEARRLPTPYNGSCDTAAIAVRQLCAIGTFA
jgi:hypothetical protein